MSEQGYDAAKRLVIRLKERIAELEETVKTKDWQIDEHKETTNLNLMRITDLVERNTALEAKVRNLQG